VNENSITHTSAHSYGEPSAIVNTQLENPLAENASIPSTDKLLNRNLFAKDAPEELKGFYLENFSISTNQTVDLEKQSQLNKVRHDLYEEIHSTLMSFKNNDTYLQDKLRFRTLNYIDCKFQRDDRKRLYIEIILDTIRNTKISTLCRFFIHGNNLYLACDSYVLGRLKKRQLIIQIVILFLLIPSLPVLFAFFVIPGIIACLYLYAVWNKFIKALLDGESLMYALRINFPKMIRTNSLDRDDCSMYLKSLFPLIIESLKVVLNKHGLLNKTLEESLKAISQNIGNQTINVNTQGGNILGAMIGSINSKVNN